MCQTQALYDAERSLSLFYEHPLCSPQEAKNIAHSLKLERRVDIVFGRTTEYDGCFFAPTYEEWTTSNNGGHIVLSATGRRVCVLLHELAHHYVLQDYFSDRMTIHQHGPQFAWRYVKLVWAVFGKHHAITLANAFVKHGVKGHQ